MFVAPRRKAACVIWLTEFMAADRFSPESVAYLENRQGGRNKPKREHGGKGATGAEGDFC